jgi:hypothetical protein
VTLGRYFKQTSLALETFGSTACTDGASTGVVLDVDDSRLETFFMDNATTYPLWTSWSPLPVVAEV